MTIGETDQLPHVALSRHAHNRLGLQRTDDAWLAARWADPATRVLVVSGTRLRVAGGDVEWLPSAEAPREGTRVLLGDEQGTIRFACLVAPQEAEDDAGQWVPLRSVLPLLADEPDRAPLLFHAIGLAEWHAATRFCPRCGGRLESRAAGHELRCSRCDRPQFPRSDPAVIMAVVRDDAILLGRQHAWPAGRWSTLAGFCEPGETLEDAVRREVDEEVGIPVGQVDYFGNQPWPLPASLMLGFVAHAESREIDVDGAEIEDARWFTRDQLRDAVAAGEVHIPRSVSISSSLLAHWYGDRLPGDW